MTAPGIDIGKEGTASIRRQSPFACLLDAAAKVRHMTARPEDDALSWDGDDDPTLDTGAPASVAKPAADTSAAESTDAASLEPAIGEAAPPAEERAPMGNAMLITIGVLAGFYAIFTIGWVIGGLRLQGYAAYLVTDIMFQGSFWLAVLAPALWFSTVYLLTRRSASWVRMLLLAAGAVLLVPWPFVMVGAVGQ